MMINEDLKALYDLPFILEKNCRYCGKKLGIRHGSTKYCNAQCRNDLHNLIRKHHQLVELADASLPINLEWIRSTVDLILVHYPGDRINDLLGHKCDMCPCLDEFRDDLDYDLFFLLCGECTVNTLLIVLKFDKRTSKIASSYLDLI